MLQPADLLLMDEPTNDLDIPTLEVLEESLTEFPGALVLVTHDRYLLDRVSTAVLGLDGQGRAQMFADYWQWEQAQLTAKPVKPEKAADSRRAPAAAREEEAVVHGGARVGEHGGADSRGGAGAGGDPRGDAVARRGVGRRATARLLREDAGRPRPKSRRSMRAGRSWKPNRPDFGRQAGARPRTRQLGPFVRVITAPRATPT